MFKHLNIQTFLLPIMNPLPVDPLKSPVFWLPLIKKDKKNHTWPNKFVVSINFSLPPETLLHPAFMTFL